MNSSGASGDAGKNRDEYSVDEYFFTKNGIDTLDFAWEPLRIGGPLEKAGHAFSSSLLGTALTAMSFMVLARRVTSGVAYQSMVSFSVGFGRSSEEAKKRVDDFIESKGGMEKFGDSAEHMAESFLKEFLEDGFGRGIAIQSLNQCTVLVWSAFEALAADVFVCALNTKPQLASTLLHDEKTRNSYRPKDIAERLENYNYDLSGRMENWGQTGRSPISPPFVVFKVG